MVTAGCSNFQRAASMRLAAHVGHVGQRARAERLHRQFGGGRLLGAIERGTDFQQRARGEGFDVAGDGGLCTVGQRHDQAAAGLRRCQGGGQHAIDTAQLAGQGEFAEKFVLGQGLPVDLPAGGQDAECDRQIETAAFLG